jgi:CHAT domain-containing protein
MKVLFALLVVTNLNVLAIAAASKTAPKASAKITALLKEGEENLKQSYVAAADARFRDALRLALETKDRKSEAAARNGVARAFGANLWEVLAHLQLALNIHREYDDQKGVAADLARMGEIYLMHGLNARAVPPLREAVRLQHQLALLDAEAQSREQLALALQAIGAREDALANLSLALELRLKTEPDNYDTLRVAARLGSLELALGAYESAASHLQLALDTLLRLQGKLSPKERADARAAWLKQGQRGLAAIVEFGRSIAQGEEDSKEATSSPAIYDPDLTAAAEELFISNQKEAKVAVGETGEPANSSRRSDLFAIPDIAEAWDQWIRDTSRALKNRDQLPIRERDSDSAVAEWLADQAGAFNILAIMPRRMHAPSEQNLSLQMEHLNRMLAEAGYKATVSLDSIRHHSVFDDADMYPQGVTAIHPDTLSQIPGSAVGLTLNSAEAMAREVRKQVAPANAQLVEGVLASTPCEMAIVSSLRRIHKLLGHEKEATALHEREWALLWEETQRGSDLFSAYGGLSNPELDAERRLAKQLGLSIPPIFTERCNAVLPQISDDLWEADLAAARGHLKKAISQYAVIAQASSTMRPFALTRIPPLYEQLGDKERAIVAYRDAVEAVETMQGGLRLEQLSASWASTQAPLYERVVGLLHDAGRSDDAFDYAERGRARAFLNQLAHRTLPTGNVPPEMAAELLQLRRRLAELEDVLPRDQSSSASAHDALQRRHDQLLARLAQSHPQFVSLAQVDAVSIKQAQRDLLPKGTTLVEYFMLDERTLAWIIDSERVQCVELKISTAAVRGLVGRFVALLVERNAESVSVASEVHRQLFAPLERYIRNSNILIVPHGVLHHLPFAALRNERQGRYLVEDYVITLAPSASALRYLAGLRPATGSLLALGNPDNSLPYAGREVATIGAIYGHSALTGKDASERRLRDDCGSADIVHIAAHLRYDEVFPALTRIKLASDGSSAPFSSERDGNLHLYEVYELQLRRGALVVLSACETALGERDNGDAVVGLTRGFVYAGASAVVSTLWPIEDESSATLMEHFYRRLREGMARGRALTEAQRQILKRPGWEPPYYWAAFTMTGRG